MTATGITTQEPHQGGAAVGRLRQDHGGVRGDREEFHILGYIVRGEGGGGEKEEGRVWRRDKRPVTK